ncbi:MarR family winged helix-turn-helix transcriptional regulator [Pseudoduganella aquatica]|uniref:MarR family transcriptional regulator n=1 Tax=Pseudoduganella aquatica TaxID=2660641 RepID=A0A7X4HEC6_9BURK|nr:MarR family winged helix-turn-helix transcriptional regulator [Pseudoduganella aquatica]MYN09659.1 MarR family transcriptional regulator [Pseudoduganella aquatica]
MSTADLDTPLCNCFALRQAARHVTSLYDRHLAPSGLATSQYSLLAHIRALPGIGMQQLSERMVMDRTSLVRAIKPLARDGYVLQAPDPENSRKLVFSLTAAGQAKFEEAHGYWAQAQAEYEAGVGAERAAALRAELRSLTQNGL